MHFQLGRHDVLCGVKRRVGVVRREVHEKANHTNRGKRNRIQRAELYGDTRSRHSLLPLQHGVIGLNGRIDKRHEEQVIQLHHRSRHRIDAQRVLRHIHPHAEPQRVHIAPLHNVADRAIRSEVPRVHVQQVVEGDGEAVQTADGVEAAHHEMV